MEDVYAQRELLEKYSKGADYIATQEEDFDDSFHSQISISSRDQELLQDFSCNSSLFSQEIYPPDKYVAFDSMTNIAIIPVSVLHLLPMKRIKLKYPMQFGSASNGNITTLTHIASCTVNAYLPLFHIGPESIMTIIGTYWLSKMGYKFVILPYEEGFNIVSIDEKVIYHGKQHTDKFHYVPWEFLFTLLPCDQLNPLSTSLSETTTIEKPWSDIDCYVNSVCAELDNIEFVNSTSRRKISKPVSAAVVQAIRESHSRWGHTSPRAVAETIALQARADIPTFTATQVLDVMQRWPCIFCRSASMRSNSENEGSGVKSSAIGAIWSVDNKDGYPPCLKWGYTGYHICQDHANDMLKIRGHKGHNAQSLLQTLQNVKEFVSSRGYNIERFVVDAGKVETSAQVTDGCAKMNIAIDPVPPKSQHMNKVERSIQTVDNKKNAVLAEAIMGGTIGESGWFSALSIVIMSFITQVHKGSYRGLTPYEDYYKVPPNLDRIFAFRLGQLVTVTMIEDHINKTSHSMRSSACIALHPEPMDGGTWVWCPKTAKAYLRGNKHIAAVEYSEMPNQSKVQYRTIPEDHANATYPDSSIVKLINRHAQDSRKAVSVIHEKSTISQDDCDSSLPVSILQSIDKTQKTDPALTFDSMQIDTSVTPMEQENLASGPPITLPYPPILVHANAPDTPVTAPKRGRPRDVAKLDPAPLTELLDISNPTPTEDQVANMIYWVDEHTSSSNSTVLPKDIRVVAFSGDLPKPVPSSRSEFNIRQALAENFDVWMPLVDKLLKSHQSSGFIKQVDPNNVPNDAQWFPASIVCRDDKVDTKRPGNQLINYVRFIVQDSVKRRKLPAHEVYSSVATAKNIKEVICIAAWHGLLLQMADIKTAFPTTKLPNHLRGKIFLKLPKCLGGICFEMITCIEGFQLSNHIYDSTIKAGLIAHGFRIFPGDEQMITKETEDNHFILFAKVVDNFIITATCDELVTELYKTIESMGYIMTTEADDKFIGMEIRRQSNGNIFINQERHIRKLIAKYNIVKTAPTPLPSNFSLENYSDSGVSPTFPIKQYQEAVGDVMWIMQTRFEIVHGMSMVSQKTHFCTERDYEAVIHILEYLNADPSLPLIYLRAPLHQRTTDKRNILSMPSVSFLNGDGSNNGHGSKGPAGDQLGYHHKKFSPKNGAIRAVSKRVVVALASTETEINWAVLAVRDFLDTYFLDNFIGFSNIGQMILQGDNLSSEALITSTSPTQKKSKHFSMLCAWIRQFYDNYLIWPIHTPSELLSADALTKRLPEAHFIACRNDILGIKHINTEATICEHIPIKKSDHQDQWPVVPCSATADYDK